VEREGFPVANLVAKMEAGELDAAPVFTDVKTFPYGKFRGCVDILSGGFPCQPFSAAGKRQATDDPRHLFPYIRDGIRDCQPRIVFLENVEGIISAKTGDGESVLQYVLRELEGLGYRATAGIFSASEVGAPHQRKRVFILGLDDSRLQRQEESEQQAAGLEQSSEELGNASNKRCEQDSSLRSEQQSSGTNEVSGESRGKLGNATSECNGLNKTERQRGDTSSRPSKELGNASNLRLQQHSTDSREAGTDQSGEERGVYESQGASSLSEYGPQSQGSQELGDSKHDGWPARPNEPQYEWEEPRVVESQLGRTVNGNASRLDRLRLLGNGVVPATASKAFVTLIQRLV
jgi:DNA (cytosine-5)-methyltransferase 1